MDRIHQSHIKRTIQENYWGKKNLWGNQPLYEIVFKTGRLVNAYDDGLMLEAEREGENIGIFIPYNSIKCVEIFDFKIKKGIMKLILSLLILFLFLPDNSFSQEFIAKILNVYTSDNITSLPVLTGGNKLVIEFDVQGKFIPNMNIVFRFCDNGWTPTKNIFLLNSQYSTYYFLDFEELPIMVVDDARYHHKSAYPDDRDQVQFPFSGKWRFYLTDTEDSSIVYATGKFYVVNDDVNLGVNIKRDELEDQSYWPVELAKAINVTTDFYLPDDFHPSFVDRIEIVDNQRLYDPVVIDRETNTLYRFYKWDANRSFTFTARDIPAGNEFRQVDIRDHNLFIAKDVRAQLDGLELLQIFS